MNRRTFLQATGLAATSAGLAGCTGAGGGDTDSGADVSATVVRNAPENPAPAADAVGPVTHQESDVLLLANLIFQRAGEKGVVVAGDATNDGDQAFEDVTVEVSLWDADESEDANPQSATAQTDHGRLAAGETWQWAATFEEDPGFEIEHYAVTATANYADDGG
jgi:hypothetical protein